MVLCREVPVFASVILDYPCATREAGIDTGNVIHADFRNKRRREDDSDIE